ncbi:MAG: hypothetical protein N2254_04025 [bacterium]|nr:hypothetical protein [bacterium]MDW8086479.1 hypothetical protein [Candidatus Calescibacterium sp.]
MHKQKMISVIEKIIEFLSSSDELNNNKFKNILRSRVSENLTKILYLSLSLVHTLPVGISVKLISLPADVIVSLILVCYQVVYFAKKNNIDIKKDKRKIAEIVFEYMLPHILKNSLSLKKIWRRKLKMRNLPFIVEDIFNRLKFMEEFEQMLLEAYHGKREKHGSSENI